MAKYRRGGCEVHCSFQYQFVGSVWQTLRPSDPQTLRPGADNTQFKALSGSGALANLVLFLAKHFKQTQFSVAVQLTQ